MLKTKTQPELGLQGDHKIGDRPRHVSLFISEQEMTQTVQMSTFDWPAAKRANHSTSGLEVCASSNPARTHFEISQAAVLTTGNGGTRYFAKPNHSQRRRCAT